MAGIYIHIPFCKKKCHYCDFYSNTQLNLSDSLVTALNKELVSRKDYIKEENITSVYFGGGTPSMLNIKHVENILEGIQKNFNLSKEAEITFECNPDDLNFSYLKALKSLGINRLSIGIQSLNDEILRFLNRRHNAKEALDSIILAKAGGFDEISIDLIFGIPGLDIQEYEKTLNKIIALNIPHISAYQLTIEPNTVLGNLLKKNKFKPAEEEDVLSQFDLTIKKLDQQHYQHYEVSNYCQPGHESSHNLLYWNNGSYLGIGPSAHSFDGYSRQWNISDTRSYIHLVNENKTFFEREVLTEEDRYNEYLLTGLRTSKGISKKYIHDHFNIKIVDYFLSTLKKLDNQWYESENEQEHIILTKKGLFILDFIINLFYYI